MNPRRILSVILASITLSISAALPKLAPGLSFTNAAGLTVVNKATPGPSTWKRVEVSKYPSLWPLLNTYYSYPTGMAVVFRTNSPTIAARWVTDDSLHQNNMTPIAQRGLDLYIADDDGSWTFAGVGRPQYNGTHHRYNIVRDMDTTMHRCMLYLPLMCKLDSLEIGIDANASIFPDASPFTPGRKVVFVGSSITHGLSASRPGMTYPARIGRALNLEMPNLGASGQCKLEQEFARIIADIQADAFIIDGFSNPSASQIRKRLLPFVTTIRKAHPNVPLIFLQTEIRETGSFDLKKRHFEQQKRQAAREEMQKVMASFPDIYFIDPAMNVGSDHEAMVDGIHPTDLGFDRMITDLIPALQSILASYGISK